MYLLLRGGVVATILNADGYDDVDIEMYDSEYFRDTLDAGFLGRSVTFQPQDSQISVTGSGQGPYTITNEGLGDFNGVIFQGSGTPAVPPDPAIVPTTAIYGYVQTPNVLDPFAEEDDSYNHVDPRPLKKTRTMRIWKDSDAKEVGHVWLDRLISTSATIPTYPV